VSAAVAPASTARRQAQRAQRDRPDRDLVAAVRGELAAIEPARACCRAAERAGLGTAGSGRARTPAIGRLAVRLATDAEPAAGFAWLSAKVHCRTSFLRGMFLAHGSLSLAGGRMHLELVVPLSELQRLATQLADFGLTAGQRVRRGSGVLTWKRTDTIVAFLRRIGATASTLELESRLVTRSLQGNLNRALNAETANLRRSVDTAHRQLEQLATLEAKGRLSRMPRSVQVVADARRRAPEASFTQLANGLGLSRGQVQRAFERIEQAALQLDARLDG
jgi:DNA-binding protein WhiA